MKDYEIHELFNHLQSIRDAIVIMNLTITAFFTIFVVLLFFHK